MDEKPAHGGAPTVGPPPPLTPFARFTVRLGAPLDIGPTPAGHRRTIPIVGGDAVGIGWTGEILPGGADWQQVNPDGSAEIHARYTLRLDDGTPVQVTSTGKRTGPPEVLRALAAGEIVPRAAYYFRTLIQLETGAPAWIGLNRRLYLGIGDRAPDSVGLDVFDLG